MKTETEKLIQNTVPWVVFVAIALWLILSGRLDQWLPEHPVVQTTIRDGRIPGSIPGYTPTTIEVDDCEYIVLLGMHEFAITHKGNCKNPIHGGH